MMHVQQFSKVKDMNQLFYRKLKKEKKLEITIHMKKFGICSMSSLKLQSASIDMDLNGSLGMFIQEIFLLTMMG